MRELPTDGYADRIAWALGHGRGPASVRALAKEMKERFPDLRGTSYGGVRMYAEGRVAHPRADLLRAMAEVMGVRGDWVAFGQGGRTEDEEERRHEQEALSRSVARGTGQDAGRLMNAVLDALGVPSAPEDGAPLTVEAWAGYRHRQSGIPVWVAPVAELCRRLEADAHAVGSMLRGPLEVADVSVRTLSPHTLSDYILAMVPALLVLAGPRPDPFTLTKKED